MTNDSHDNIQKLQRVTLKDGTLINIDDYVYMDPDIPSEPLYIARILTFESDTHAKVGWFYCPKDVLGGNRKRTFDVRLLVCSMHSDVNPISSIRGKCNVMHTHFIKNLEAYKEQANCFYYNQLYDRYTHSVYDVVPLEIVKNLPDSVMRSLRQYTFIVVEAGKASDFTDRRVCKVCKSWCQCDDGIQCESCKSDFHKICVNITKKPPKGYV
ncbi:BAH domain-containing protein [Chytridium lagenaria]|nr:BAH domain-containing protein [Chytridium lagenaria]